MPGFATPPTATLPSINLLSLTPTHGYSDVIHAFSQRLFQDDLILHIMIGLLSLPLMRIVGVFLGPLDCPQISPLKLSYIVARCWPTEKILAPVLVLKLVVTIVVSLASPSIASQDQEAHL